MKHSDFALAVLLLCLLAHQACGTTFRLGGTPGWTNKADIDYDKWLSDYKIKVGDNLVFANADTTDHSVIQVDKLGYETCGSSGKQLDISTIQPGIYVSFTYYESGQTYYICGVPSHCMQGMKVAVQVLNADGSNNTSTSKTNSAPAMQWTSQLLLTTFVAAVTMIAYLT